MASVSWSYHICFHVLWGLDRFGVTDPFVFFSWRALLIFLHVMLFVWIVSLLAGDRPMSPQFRKINLRPLLPITDLISITPMFPKVLENRVSVRLEPTTLGMAFCVISQKEQLGAQLGRAPSWGCIAVLWSLIGILMRLLGTEPYSAGGLSFISQYSCGTILGTVYSMVRDWQVLCEPMIYYWPKLIATFLSYTVFPFTRMGAI